MWMIIGLLAVPLIEIALFVTLGAKLGLWVTLAWILASGALGIILLKGVAMLGTHQLTTGIREELRDPRSPLAHRLLVGIAGLFLLLPGFFTDALGLLLLFPFVRNMLIRFLGARINSTFQMRGSVVDGEWRDVTTDSHAKIDSQRDGTQH